MCGTYKKVACVYVHQRRNISHAVCVSVYECTVPIRIHHKQRAKVCRVDRMVSILCFELQHLLQRLQQKVSSLWLTKLSYKLTKYPSRFPLLMRVNSSLMYCAVECAVPIPHSFVRSFSNYITTKYDTLLAYNTK